MALVVSALAEYMADAMELFRLKRYGLWFKQDTKSLVKLIWHFGGAWLVAEQNLTKQLVHRLDHTKHARVAPTFLNKGSPKPF